MTRDDLDHQRGRKAKRGKIERARRPPFVVSPSGIEAVTWLVPNRAAAWESTGGVGTALVSLPRVLCLETEMRV